MGHVDLFRRVILTFSYIFSRSQPSGASCHGVTCNQFSPPVFDWRVTGETWLNAPDRVVWAHKCPHSDSVARQLLEHKTKCRRLFTSGKTRTMSEATASNNDKSGIQTELDRLSQELMELRQELTKRNAEYERMASYDTLTGLLNRRAILEKAGEWLHHMRRYNGHLSVAMLDIDHFKRVNDRYGHRVGDRVLAALSSMMQRSIRNTDFVGRYGGEEFLILLPHTDAVGAGVMAERVRASLAGVPMHDAEGATFKVTASLGIAEYIDGDDEDSLLSRADAALYRAKEAGRNRVETAACPA